ncbi:zinc metallopeptidase [Chlorobium sp. BLA1]|uniref:zinc metallopeptidase n=1 Tax=Candidatus Chlorobium masyuteum TaxID=2716876 RepID=UPI0014243E98|nr:zinc metallopeptidase [Candidatus Chlorobium masyuteum]NHQ61253.1 zinc metallopeptidase [Candidatus Chlorobium masyuteum]NTU45821.1 zinc metallopeptidase [Chlorobiaceae bacterium]
MYLDPLYFVFALPPMLLGLWAQFKVKSAFKKYSRVPTQSGVNGSQAARRILERGGVGNVTVEATHGMLSDHYDPRHKALRLSEEVFNLASIASVGVAAHEAGHALQDKTGYMPLQLRSIMVPAVSIGSNLGPIIFMAGMFLAGTLGTTLAWAGIALFGATALFALVTLPVEFDASRRAKELLVSQGIVSSAEMKGINAVLNAAALTYVAAAAQAIMQLVYFLSIMNRRDS